MDLKKVVLTNLHNGRKLETYVSTNDNKAAIIGSGKSTFESAVVSNATDFGSLPKRLFSKPSLDDDVAFFAGLSKCIERNLGIVKGIYLQANRVKSPGYKGVIGGIASDLQLGEKLSEAMAKHPKIFSEDILALIEAGEEAGQLGEVCKRIAINKKKSSKIAKKLKSGMIYPIIVTFIGIGVVILMSYTLVPSMSKLYKELGSKLPTPTVMLMKLSDFLKYKWYYLSIPIVACYLVFTNWGKIYQIHKVQTFFFKMPVIGKIIQKNALAISFRIFAMLIEANVRMTNALEITQRSAPLWYTATFFKKVKQHVVEGVGLTEAFLHESHWLGAEGRNICGLMEVASETGAGTELLNEIAEDFEEELEAVANSIDKLLEPVTMVILGVIVGFLIYAIYSPVFSMGDAMFKK